MVWREVALLFLIFALVVAQRKKDLSPEELARLKEQTGMNPDEMSDDAIILSPPKLTDEDEGSKFMPQAYRCDACRAIAIQFTNLFSKAESKKKSGKLSYVEILDHVEQQCQDEYKEFGLKSVLGENKFSAPGLETAMMSGMVDAGGLWKRRMQKLCEELVGEYEEDGIYAMWSEPESTFEQELCRNYCKGKSKTEL
ncbi:marginal zone B- and B1-cell-specific protein-like [Physella acuta]|uniref:marginal zone B- and B1-cell-specific protein-like n=1 Tax=Physella acuta TaxID=109671 RepID=UPI0027DAD530|nr:marginal zone B- and B1-cell-specific protein-like [Physella acuta]